MKHVLTLLLLIIIFNSCKEENSGFYVNGKKIKVVAAKIKELNGENIGPVDKYGLIDDIYYYNGNLLMHDVKADSIFIRYNLKDHKLDKSITKGEGPNQIKLPEFIKITRFENFTDNIQAYVFNKGLIQVDFNEQKYKYLFNLGFYDYRSSVQSIVKIRDSVYGMVSLDPQQEFVIYDDLTKKTKIIPPLKNLELNYNTETLQVITPSDIGFNKKNNIIYTWKGVLNSINLYDKEGNFLKSFSYGKNKNIVDKKIQRNYFYYYDLKSNGDYIYGLYLGFTPIKKIIPSSISNIKTQIHLFNLKTDEITIYQLDRLIRSATVDFKNNIIYAIEENNESQPLVKYEMDKEN